MNDWLNLLRASVRPVVTFAAVGAFLVLAIDQGALADTKEVALLVAGFWFASRRGS